MRAVCGSVASPWSRPSSPRRPVDRHDHVAGQELRRPVGPRRDVAHRERVPIRGAALGHVAQHVANHRLLSSRPDKYVIDTPSTVTLGTSQSELRCFFKGHLLSYSPIVFLAENGSY